MHFVVTGEDSRARPLFERSLECFRQLGDRHGVAAGLYGLAYTRPEDGLAAARAQAEESLDILRAVGDRRTFAKVLWCLAGINADDGSVQTAAAQFEEALTLFVEFGDRWFCVIVLELAAFIASSSGETERAVRLLGAADAVLEEIGVPLLPRFRDRHADVVAGARGTLGDRRFAAAWDDGRRLPLRATVELVGAARIRGDTEAPEGLTARELEVLALVSEGRSDAEVADTLVLSVRTVNAHLRSIYRKLDVHSRSAATRYALEHGLASMTAASRG
jgi:non-specific serine/threonine protein kinase